MQVEGNVEGVTPRQVPSLLCLLCLGHSPADACVHRRGAFEVTAADGGMLLFSRLQVRRVRDRWCEST